MINTLIIDGEKENERSTMLMLNIPHREEEKNPKKPAYISVVYPWYIIIHIYHKIGFIIVLILKFIHNHRIL